MTTQNLEMAESEKEHLVYLKGRVNEVLGRLPLKVRGQEAKRAVIQLQQVATSIHGVQYENVDGIYEAIRELQKELGVL